MMKGVLGALVQALAFWGLIFYGTAAVVVLGVNPLLFAGAVFLFALTVVAFWAVDGALDRFTGGKE